MNFRKQSYLYEEEILVSMVSKGDLDAFNQLVLTHQDMAYNYAYALLGNPDLAEDATQEGFIKAFQGIHAFRGGSFRAWLLKIVTNSAYDVLRRRHRHPTQPLFSEDENGDEVESAASLIDPTVSVQDAVEQNERSKEIYRILNELPEVYRRVITLIDLYEFDYLEAAEVLKIPIGTVKSRLARGRIQMKQNLKCHVTCVGIPM